MARALTGINFGLKKASIQAGVLPIHFGIYFILAAVPKIGPVALGRTVSNTVEEAGGVASRALLEEAGVEEWQWQTAGVNVCPDCKPRNGDVRTLDQWRLVGLPKSGFSVCGHSCQCTLVPAGKGRKIRRRAERKKELKERFGN